MKKWYVITGILALLLVISISTCSKNSNEMDRLRTELADAKAELAQAIKAEGQLASVRSELADTEDELTSARNKLAQVEEQLAGTESELVQLEDIVNLKEFVFDDSLRVFEVNASWYNRYMDTMSGKVQNVSTEQVRRVSVVVFSYDENGGLIDLDEAYWVHNLYPQEVGEWSVRVGKLKGATNYAIYAFGNRRD
ncbi:hypothetical protein ES708_08537 [subsurface metagenome]